MADDDPRDYGTLIISALLILALIFAGMWIVFYVAPANHPQVLYPWFGWAAAVIVVVGLLNYAVRGRRKR
ncbi:MAG: hypothetical protein ABI629_00835 [bacterium]